MAEMGVGPDRYGLYFAATTFCFGAGAFTGLLSAQMYMAACSASGLTAAARRRTGARRGPPAGA